MFTLMLLFEVANELFTVSRSRVMLHGSSILEIVYYDSVSIELSYEVNLAVAYR